MYPQQYFLGETRKILLVLDSLVLALSGTMNKVLQFRIYAFYHYKYLAVLKPQQMSPNMN